MEITPFKILDHGPPCQARAKVRRGGIRGKPAPAGFSLSVSSSSSNPAQPSLERAVDECRDSAMTDEIASGSHRHSFRIHQSHSSGRNRIVEKVFPSRRSPVNHRPRQSQALNQLGPFSTACIVHCGSHHQRARKSLFQNAWHLGFDSSMKMMRLAFQPCETVLIWVPLLWVLAW